MAENNNYIIMESEGQEFGQDVSLRTGCLLLEVWGLCWRNLNDWWQLKAEDWYHLEPSSNSHVCVKGK